MASHAPGDFGQGALPDPDLAHLIVEDDAPVDNLFSEKQQRLLTEPLYASWSPPGGVPFLACANVGLFTSVREQAIVPDVMVSLDVVVDSDFSQRKNKSYFTWQLGKVPEMVLEIVSNQSGGELSAKLRKYERARIAYYVVFDPERQLSDRALHVFELRVGALVQKDDATFPLLGLDLTLWRGSFEGVETEWLRWVRAGALIPTGKERAEHERERAEHERERAEHERERAEHERERANRADAEVVRLQAALAGRGGTSGDTDT